MTWTQPICLPCWRTDWPQGGMDREPFRIKGWPEERCCLCGRPTKHGIYVRIDPKTVAYPTGDAAEATR